MTGETWQQPLLDQIANWCAVLAAAVGATVLVGWAFGLDLLTQVHHGLVSMKANTATGMLLCGCALWARRRARVRIALAVAVLVLACATLWEYWMGRSVGIDQLLIRQDAWNGSPFPGRMSPLSAANLILISLGLAGLKTGRRGEIGVQILAIFAATAGGITILGYLYGIQNLFRFAVVAPMPVHGAFALLMLGIGLLCACERGLAAMIADPKHEGHLLRVLVPTVLAIPIVSGLLVVEAVHYGYLDPALGTALFATVNLTGLIILLWRVSLRMEGRTLELSRSEERLRLALDAVQMGTYEYRCAGDRLILDERGSRQLELPVGAKRKDFESRIHPEDLARVLDAATVAMVDPGTGDFSEEFRIQRSDGTRWIRVKALVDFEVKSGQRIAVRSIGTTLDITQQKAAERELEQKDTLLRALSDTTTDPIWAKDRESRLLWANPAMFHQLGKEPFQLLGKPEREWMENPTEAMEIMANDRMVMEVGETRVLEETLTMHGKKRIFLVTKSPYRNGKGEIVGTVGMSRELTSIRSAEEALRESEYLRRQALEAAKLGTWYYNVETGEVGCDERTHQIFGTELTSPTFAELVGQFIHPQDRAMVETAVVRAIDPAGDGSYAAEYRIIRPDGGIRWLSALGQVTFTGDGDGRRPVRMVGTVGDITSKKHYEQELNNARDAAERAKQAAEQANCAKDHFLAVLSHELRTPLTPVLAVSSMLENDPNVPSTLREDIRIIQRNVELETRLIDDLLDLTRIMRGKFVLYKEVVELDEIIARASEVCKPDILARGLKWGVDLGKEAPYRIFADAARLQQVFWNLLKNATKFTPHGGCVGIRCRIADRHVLAEVNDSGAGIEPEAISRIFDPFEQENARVTRHFGGLGLGLAICKAIVQAHDGTIRARSAGKNRGATFELCLPLISAEKDPGAERGTPGRGRFHPAHEKSRILLVEDHGDTARIMKRILNFHGHEVEWAGDVQTAMEMLKSRRFDLLLSDLGLPDGSGLDLMRHVREHYPGLQGIALSGFGQQDDLRLSEAAGFREHLIKPVSAARLFAVIEHALN